jgi:CheY-like chemotaxis protein
MESGLILVVDDELSIRRALHTTLSNLGFRTVVCSARRGGALAGAHKYL